MLSVPRQFGKNCITNSIVAVLIELRTFWRYDEKITDALIRKYRRPFSPTRISSQVIENAMAEVGIPVRYIYLEGSLIAALKANNVSLAIAIQSSNHHAYPIKKNPWNSDEYLAINQRGVFFAKAVYAPLIDMNDVNFYAIYPYRETVPEPVNASAQVETDLDDLWLND